MRSFDAKMIMRKIYLFVGLSILSVSFIVLVSRSDFLPQEKLVRSWENAQLQTCPLSRNRPSEYFCQVEKCLKKSRTDLWRVHVFAQARYHLSACIILKDLSSIMMATMCYLYDPLLFSKQNRSIPDEYWNNRACKGRNERQEIPRRLFQDKSWKHVAVIREPIDRFLSAWIDKCYYKYYIFGNGLYPGYCYNCGRNLSCFVMKFSEKLHTHKARRISNNFIMENHFWPQSWHCDFNTHFDDYTIIHYDFGKRRRFYKELMAIFRLQNVPNNIINEVVRQGIARLTRHTVSGNWITEHFRRQLYSDPRLLTLLLALFYDDYVMFGYVLPCI